MCMHNARWIIQTWTMYMVYEVCLGCGGWREGDGDGFWTTDALDPGYTTSWYMYFEAHVEPILGARAFLLRYVFIRELCHGYPSFCWLALLSANVHKLVMIGDGRDWMLCLRLANPFRILLCWGNGLACSDRFQRWTKVTIKINFHDRKGEMIFMNVRVNHFLLFLKWVCR